jgi:hypothetical protein
MPRFGTKTLLIVTAIVALWLSTLSGYAAGNDVRRSILLLVLVLSGFAAVYGRGRRRAFWSGFFVVMLLCGGTDLQRPLHRYLPDFAWLSAFAPHAQYQVWSSTTTSGRLRVAPATPPTAWGFATSNAADAPIWTIVVGTAWILVLSMLGGLIAMYVFSQNRSPSLQDHVPN